MNANRSPVSQMALAASAALSAMLGACVAPVQPPPPARSAPRPLPPPPQPPAVINWHDLPATPGIWRWQREGRLSVARFGEPARFSLTCNSLSGTISLARDGAAGAAITMTVLTTSASRVLAVQPGGDGAITAVIAALPARDPLFDAMAYSRGRFAVEVPGSPTLYLPSWPEVSRVIEDCRVRAATPLDQP